MNDKDSWQTGEVNWWDLKTCVQKTGKKYFLFALYTLGLTPDKKNCKTKKKNHDWNFIDCLSLQSCSAFNFLQYKLETEKKEGHALKLSDRIKN